MSVKMEQLSDTETEIIINDAVKVRISEDSYNATGEMSVEYDDEKLTEAEATEIVNNYFSRIMDYIKNSESPPP